jgi:hypothetical protein
LADDLAVCRDHDRYGGVIGGDQQSARKDGIEAVPDIAHEK